MKTIWFFILVIAGPLWAETPATQLNEGNWSTGFSGLGEVRFSQTGKDRSWDDPDASSFGGPGPYRYGGRDKNSDKVGDIKGGAFHLAHLHLLGNIRHEQKNLAQIHLMFDEQAQDEKLGVFEAFLRQDFSHDENLKVDIKAGIFMPNISLENKGTAWSTKHTITPSAINSWAGEELRATGVQASARSIQFNTLIETNIGLYSGNDGLGSILSWRGWGMHDSYSAYGKELRLRQQTLVTSGTLDPFIEVDQKPGYFARMELWWNKKIRLNYFYLDNNGDNSIRDTLTRNWSWDTRFHHIGFEWRPSTQFEILFQAIRGESLTGRTPEVDNQFDAIYLLLSKSWNNLSTAIRFDKFAVHDKDITSDSNQQKGNAKTFALNYDFNLKKRLMFEYVTNSNSRRGQESFSDHLEHTYEIWQLAYRLTF